MGLAQCAWGVPATQGQMLRECESRSASILINSYHAQYYTMYS